MKQISKQQAFTLVEVMIGLTVFALTAAGLSMLILHGRKLSETAVYKSSVNTAVYGFVEQINSMPYSRLEGATLPTKMDLDRNATLTVNEWNEVNLDINDTPTNENDDLPLEVRPIIRVLIRDDLAPRYEIELDYRWLPPLSPSNTPKDEWFQESIVFLRSTIRS
jgi:prepilin-type N-terminal cleavage/methylation domain-containing protein